MEKDLEKLEEYAKKILELVNSIKANEKGLAYKNICKNCGNEIYVSRKNCFFCNIECKRQYVKEQQKEYQRKRKANMTQEQLQAEKKDALERMRELRKLRKESKVENKC